MTKALTAGAINVTSEQAASAGRIAATLKEAAKHVDAERICPLNNGAMAPLSRGVATGKSRTPGAGAELARASIA
jgi:5-methyltetrahydropteroyltriglutamate--homocysteine methyltransferase